MKKRVQTVVVTLMMLLNGCGGGSGSSGVTTNDDTTSSETNSTCTIDTSLKGGIFTDSDGTAPRIDEIAKAAAVHHPGYQNYTQDDYRQILGSAQMGYLYGNLHTMAFENYLPDLEDPNKGWPEVAHILLRYIQANGRVGQLISHDGVSGEGMNYHFLWLAGLEKLAASLYGYKDPDNWIPPAGVKKITKPLTHADIMPPSKRWDNMVTNALKLTLPDGTDSGSHDTGLQYHDPSDPTAVSSWGAGGMHYGYSIEKAARSYLLSGYGQLGLGEGKLGDPNLQVQSILHFSPKSAANGHAHNDTLMLGLFGQGRNLLSFPGHQNQSHGSQNKNMVIVDQGWQNKAVSDIGGRLEIYATLPGIQVARVDASHIVHGGNYNGTGSTEVERYRRTYIQNTIDIEKAYLVDIFEVKGGSSHDYLIRGSGVLEQNYPQTDLSVVSSGTMSIPNSKEAVFSNTKKTSYDENQSFWIDMTFKDKPGFGTRSHFPAQKEAGELYLNEMTEQWTASGEFVPQYTLHRSGSAPLETTFVAIHEVLDGSGSSFIHSVKKEVLDADSIAIEVILNSGRIDTYLVSFNGKKRMNYGGVSADAVIAAGSTLGDKSDLWLTGGNSVDIGSRSLGSVTSEVTGKLLEVIREEDGAAYNAFETDMTLTEGYELSGQTLLLENYDATGELIYVNSYTIKSVENTCDTTRIHVNVDPGVRVTASGIEETHYPRRSAVSARLRFVNSTTTVPHIVHVSKGKELSEPINPKIGHALDGNASVELTTLPLDTAVSYKLNGSNNEQQTTSGKITLRDHAAIVFGAKNPDGFVEAKAFEENYYLPLPALNGVPVDQGLKATYYSGITYNFDLNDTNGNSYDFNRIAPKIVEGLSFEQMSPLPTTGTGVGVIVSGYIDVPTTGLYRFHTRMDRMVQLKIDDKVLIEERGMRLAPQWTGEIYLEKGLHKIQVHQYANKLAHFSVMWDGPNIPYGEIPANILFQGIQ